MSVRKSDPQLRDAKALSPSAWIACVAVSLLGAYALVAPLIGLVVADDVAATAAGAPTYSIAAGTRDVAIVLFALMCVSLLGWRKTLRLRHRRVAHVPRPRS